MWYEWYTNNNKWLWHIKKIEDLCETYKSTKEKYDIIIKENEENNKKLKESKNKLGKVLIVEGIRTKKLQKYMIIIEQHIIIHI